MSSWPSSRLPQLALVALVATLACSDHGPAAPPEAAIEPATDARSTVQPFALAEDAALAHAAVDDVVTRILPALGAGSGAERLRHAMVRMAGALDHGEANGLDAAGEAARAALAELEAEAPDELAPADLSAVLLAILQADAARLALPPSRSGDDGSDAILTTHPSERREQ